MFGFVLFIGVILFFVWVGSGSSSSGNNSSSNSSRNNRSTSLTRQYSSTATTTYGRPVATMPATVVPTVEKPVHTGLKSDYASFMQVLRENGIVYLYHFTDRRNLASIRKHGGLYSWAYCGSHGITIPYAGGNSSSRNNDCRYGLQDYVRLSFCTDHPMMWRLRQQGYDLVLLKIKVDAAVFAGTMFSDMNATDGMHSHGESLADLKRVRFSAVRRSYLRRDDVDFKYHQAEIMVKTFIPAKYIVNLNTFSA